MVPSAPAAPGGRAGLFPDPTMILPFGGRTPVVPRTAFVAPTASVVGDVDLGEDVSIWFGAVLRGDVNSIRVGARSNIQDGTVVHVNEGRERTVIGEEVTVGHQAIVHACTVGRRCLIGMGSVVLDGAEIGTEAMVAAGAVVPPGLRVPPRVLVRGIPGRVARSLTDGEIAHLARSATNYVALKDRYLVPGMTS